MPTLWVDTLFADSIASGGQVVHELDSTVFSVTERRFARATLLRTIVRLDIAPTVRDSGEGDQIVDIGIGVTSQEAFAASVVSDPATAIDFPVKGWVWRARYRSYAVSTNDQNVDIIRVDKDLRGQRKLENGRLFLVADNGANQGDATATQITGIIRALLLVG